MVPRVILHLDMDAFYASVEQRDAPELRGKPVIVGAPPERRGVVCAASYEARKFGVRSAMPSRTAARLCPTGIFRPPRMDQYRAESVEIFRLVRETGVRVEQVSVDEAYLEATDLIDASVADPEDRLAAALPLARRLKEEISVRRHLTASVGIATNKLMAKLASDYRKPDGLMLIGDRERAAFLRPLACRLLHGVGSVTAEILAKAGMQTIGQIQDHPGDLRSLLGSFGPVLKRYAVGEDDRPLELGDEVKSISSETTFERNTSDRPLLRGVLREQADEIAAKLQRRQLTARTVQVKVRYGDFSTLTRQVSVEEPLVESREIYRLACWLLGRDRLVQRPLRLLGVGVSGLSESGPRQLSLPLGASPGTAGTSVVQVEV